MTDSASCPRSRLPKLRSRPLGRTWARVMRKAGACTQEHFFLRDAWLPGFDPKDSRRAEVVATGLSYKQGVPVAVDCTLVSPLDADGKPHQGAEKKRDVTLARAQKSKGRTYAELVSSSLLCLVVAAVETGGCLHRDARELLKSAAADGARSEPARLQSIARRAFLARWRTLLSIATQDFLAATLAGEGASLLNATPGAATTTPDLLLDAGEEGGE